MKYMHAILAASLALLLAACAAPASRPSPGATPALAEAAEPAAQPTAEPTPGLIIQDPFAVTFLGEDTAPADQAGGIGPEKAVETAAQLYGEEFGGRLQSYTCVGLAEYMGETYYSVYWSQLVEDEGTANSSYMGHLYVSLDGGEVLEGDEDSVYIDFGGG